MMSVGFFWGGRGGRRGGLIFSLFLLLSFLALEKVRALISDPSCICLLGGFLYLQNPISECSFDQVMPLLLD